MTTPFLFSRLPRVRQMQAEFAPHSPESTQDEVDATFARAYDYYQRAHDLAPRNILILVHSH